MQVPSFRPLAFALAVGFVASSMAMAQPGRDKDPLSWDRNVQRIFAKHCYQCHGQKETHGDVDLAMDEDPRLILLSRGKWLNALKMLRDGEMPPEDARQPSDNDRKLMIDFLDQTLSGFDCDSIHDPGRPVLRRLNRSEYNLAVLDLTGLDLRLADDFPPDPTSYGFDNIGESLSLSPAQVEMYHAAAKTIVAELLNTKKGHRQVYNEVFMVAGETADQREHARGVLSRFATRAFRQPVDADYVNRLLQIYDKAKGQDQGHLEAIGHCLTAILMSSRFLMRVERDRAEADSPYRVSDYELASRLSFFLWSRAPDELLLSLAESGRLHQREVLSEQATRMLQDPRSGALVSNFFFQWLDFRNLATHAPDAKIFPQFDEQLRRSMSEEVRLLLTDLVQQDLSLSNLVDADFAYLDNRLADHYGISGVTSADFQRVALQDKRHGGVITSAAFVMIQADPGRTNIPRRGNFIAAQLLGDAAAAPPADVPALERIDDGVKRSLRETFELHRSSPDCQGCHQKIDPLGFSLENYDAIGRWRDLDAGVPIDASAETSAGEKFSGPAGLKAYLLSRNDEFLHTVASKLLIYALGRGLQTNDECVVVDMVAAAKANDHRLSSMIIELVNSVPFTHRKNPDE